MSKLIRFIGYICLFITSTIAYTRPWAEGDYKLILILGMVVVGALLTSYPGDVK